MIPDDPGQSATNRPLLLMGAAGLVAPYLGMALSTLIFGYIPGWFIGLLLLAVPVLVLAVIFSRAAPARRRPLGAAFMAGFVGGILAFVTYLLVALTVPV